MNIPNAITSLRIILVPIFLSLLARDLYTSSLCIFFIAGLTDALDGMLARGLDEETPLGTFLDPLADKMLITSTYALLTYKRLIPKWLGTTVISRDLMVILGFFFLLIFRKDIKPKPTSLGKMSMVSQVLTVLLALIDKIWLVGNSIKMAFFTSTFFFTAASGIQYVFIGLKVFNPSRT